jgi:hypothetical protein
MADPVPTHAAVAVDYSWWDAQRDTRANNLEGMKRCIQHRPGLVDESLHLAAKLGYVEMSLMLLPASMHPDAHARAMGKAVEFNHADLVRALIVHAPRGVDHGFWAAIEFGSVPMAQLFLATGLITAERLDGGLIHAAYSRQSTILRCLIDAGATSFTRAMRATSWSSHVDDVQLLIEKGAIGWPDHVYWSLADDPERTVHLLKCGVSRVLLTGGRAPIQAIVDEQDRRDAHIRAELDQLGVYKVLADLIVQY